jgi:NadR type nicotinamide-nucleotide adenylyltransferase
MAAIAGPDRGRRALKRVVLTGSESTGKTTLAVQLARAHGAPVVPEYARRYVTARGALLTAADVEPIARGQMALEDQAEASRPALLFKDTDLVSTVVYARHYYGACPSWIEDAARSRLADLYLLLHPDVPWVADGAYRDLPDARWDIHARFRRTLDELGARYLDVTGGWDERRATAEAAAAALIAGR